MRLRRDVDSPYCLYSTGIFMVIALMTFVLSFPLLFFMVVPKGLLSRLIVIHIPFFLAAHLHSKIISAAFHCHTTSTFRSSKTNVSISFFRCGIADSYMKLVLLAAPSMSTCNFVKKNRNIFRKIPTDIHKYVVCKSSYR